MIWPRAILWLLAIGFAGFGVAYASWPAGLLASACVLLGLVIVRVVGLLSAADAGTVIYLGLTIEFIGAALALWGVNRISIYGAEPESGSR